MKLDFITFCHPGDIHRLYHDTWLRDMIASHDTRFDTVRIVHQRCGNIIPPKLPYVSTLCCDELQILKSEDHPDILAEFGLPEHDGIAEQYTHGPTAPHYYKWHCINHFIGLKASDADYIVFSDTDCLIQSHNPGESWIRTGLDVLRRYPDILIVGPGDGADVAEAVTAEGYRLTKNVSQQLFLCERKKLASIDFNIDWGGDFRAPGGPFQEYYFLLEGRIWRHLDKHDMWRCILPDHIARYWHFNRLTPDGLFEMDYDKY